MASLDRPTHQADWLMDVAAVRRGAEAMGTGSRLVIAMNRENGEHVARVYVDSDEGVEVLATARGSQTYVQRASVLFAREWRAARELGAVGQSAPRLRVAQPRQESGTLLIDAQVAGSRPRSP